MSTSQQIALFAVVTAITLRINLWLRLRKRKDRGRWEAVPDSKGEMWRVRWSKPDERGYYLYVRHYGGNGPEMNQHMARRNAEEFNQARRSPYEFGSNYCPE